MASEDKKNTRSADISDDSSVTEFEESEFVLIDIEPDDSDSAHNSAAEFAQEASTHNTAAEFAQEASREQEDSTPDEIETEIDVPEEMIHPVEEDAHPYNLNADTPAAKSEQDDGNSKSAEIQKSDIGASAPDEAEEAALKETSTPEAVTVPDEAPASKETVAAEAAVSDEAAALDGTADTNEVPASEKTAASETSVKRRRHFKRPQPFRSLPLHKKVLRILSIVLIIVLITAGAAVAYGYSTLHYFYSKVNKPTAEENTAQSEEIDKNLNEEVANSEEAGTLKGYINIALFGVDSRSNKLDSGTRSDSIMIASINQDTNEIKLVSIYRDTFLDISGASEFSKCNAAYNNGAEAAVSMLNRNLDLNIHDYITIGFSGLIDAIDAVGGLDINIQENEIQYLNSYAKTMASQQKRTYTPVTNAGVQTLNGLQATAYCRIRYTAGDDYKRAERQRSVLTKLFNKCKSSSVTQLYSLLQAILPDVYTSLTEAEIISILPNLINFTLDSSQGFPNVNMRKSGILGRYGSVIVPITLEANVRWLHTYLYDDYSYTPSLQVTNTSEEITEIARARGMSW